MLVVKKPPANAGDMRHKFDPWVRKIPQKEMQCAPVFSTGESHGQRSLAGHSLWDCRESDMTECAHTHQQIMPPESQEPSITAKSDRKVGDLGPQLASEVKAALRLSLSP